MERSAVRMVKAGVHYSFRISRQMDPSVGWIFGWQIFVVKLIIGGLKGKSVGKRMFKKKTPPAYGEPSGPMMVPYQ